MNEWKWNFKPCLKVLGFLDEISCPCEARCPLIFSHYVWFKICSWPIFSTGKSALSTQIELERPWERVPVGRVLPNVPWWKLLLQKPSWVFLQVILITLLQQPEINFIWGRQWGGRWSDVDSALCFAFVCAANDSSQPPSFEGIPEDTLPCPRGFEIQA